MQEHTNVEDYQALGSSQFLLMVSFPCARVVRNFSIAFVTPHLHYIAFFFCIKVF